MKIQGTFLTSRAGRRIFWTLLLAAAAPIATFGVAMYQLLSDQFDAQVTKQQVQLVKFVGMGLLDRLLVARTALTITARTGQVNDDPDVGHRNGRVLADVAQIDAGGGVLVGSASLAARWREHVLRWMAHRGGNPSTLMVDRDPAPRAVRPVLMVLSDDGRRDRVWIAEVEPSFLFSELSVDASGTRICVFDASRSPVFCPGWRGTDPGGPESDTDNPQWRLFLRSDFAIDDWTLMAMDAVPDPSGAAPLARMSALVAVCTLLFVGMLGLIQVRRTMVPLERLIAGTRRLSERDYAARVHVARRDEFGELAKSFNHMAERIDRQIKAMQVQSSIDHEILNGLNVARVLQRVAQRLESLGAGAAACVVEFDHASQLGRVHTASAPMAIIGVPRGDVTRIAELTAGETVRCDDPPPWLHAFAPHAGHLWLRCARADSEVLGLLAIRAGDHAFDDVETECEVAELGDRVSVALSSADRERRLLERATRDGLTGLANRTGLYESIDALLDDRPSAAFSLLFLDLDGFKEINDSLGHHVGDDLLRTVAARLRLCVPRGALVARPGGDEFVVVVHGMRRAADELASQLCAALARPVDLAGRTVVIGASVGMAHHPEDGDGAVDLMRRADMAMYAAKARGGGTASWFEPVMDQRMAERAALLADLRLARERGELHLHYQPRVDVRSRSIRSAEALLRWSHPTRGFVPTTTFIKLLEETGLIDDVGLWVLDQAVDQFVRWRGLGLALDFIAVNLSTRQLQEAELPGRVAAILERHRVSPDCLELEVTESIFMGDAAQAIRTLQRLSDSGVHIALDDFGTGYSSLSYLHKLPIGVIKVDRSFVVELGRRDSALALTRSIVALARALGLRVVAEGVETEQQVELLLGLGYDELQGWYYAPAMEPAAFVDFVSRPLAIGVVEPS